MCHTKGKSALLRKKSSCSSEHQNLRVKDTNLRITNFMKYHMFSDWFHQIYSILFFLLRVMKHFLKKSLHWINSKEARVIYHLNRRVNLIMQLLVWYLASDACIVPFLVFFFYMGTSSMVNVTIFLQNEPAKRVMTWNVPF